MQAHWTTFALNARSGFRMGGTGRPLVDAVETQFQAPYGYFTPPQQFAMAARAHMDRYGTKPEHLGQIAVQQRAFARDNERAMMRAPMTMSDYLAARYVVEPFRLFDCCLETDAAKRKPMFREIEDFLDQESPWMTIGFTSHLHMWKKYLKGMPMERVRLSWSKTDTMWVDK